jgi:hypothetical protein
MKRGMNVMPIEVTQILYFSTINNTNKVSVSTAHIKPTNTKL